MDLQSSSISDISGYDIIPKMDTENNSELESLVDAEVEIQSEIVSETDIEISEVIDDTLKSKDTEILSNDEGSLMHNLLTGELEICIEPPSINSNPELQVETISISSTNTHLSVLTTESHSDLQLNDTEVSYGSIPGLDGITRQSKDDSNDVEVESSIETNKHSIDATSIPYTYDDLPEKTTSPYEVYARHMFQTPIPPPRHKKKLNLDQNTAMDSEELEMGITPRSKRLCRCEDIDSSDMEGESPSLDESISMETAVMVEEIPSMDTTLYIDASPTMDTENSLSPSQSYESISDVESLPDIPISFSSTRRPLMLPSAKHID